MKIGIYTNKDKDKNYILTKQAAKYLKNAGAKVLFYSKMESAFSGEEYFEIEKGATDAIIVFGGDGTILGIAEKAAKAQIAVLGINLGYLGFLSETENDNIENALKLLLSGNYTIEERSMLKSISNKKDYYALNDIVFLRDASFVSAKKLVQFEIYVNNNLVDKIDSDGLIVSTPTGSTAYSLSAGGPILSPQIKATLITAICPHSLHFRPIVFSDTDKIEIKISNENRVCVAFDGYNKFNMEYAQRLTVTKSEYKANFIRFKHTNFYFKLRNKLNKWSTTSI